MLTFRENLYGNAKGGGGSQPPVMIELYKKHATIDPMWHVRHLGELFGWKHDLYAVELRIWLLMT